MKVGSPTATGFQSSQGDPPAHANTHSLSPTSVDDCMDAVHTVNILYISLFHGRRFLSDVRELSRKT